MGYVLKIKTPEQVLKASRLNIFDLVDLRIMLRNFRSNI